MEKSITEDTKSKTMKEADSKKTTSMWFGQQQHKEIVIGCHAYKEEFGSLGQEGRNKEKTHGRYDRCGRKNICEKVSPDRKE